MQPNEQPKIRVVIRKRPLNKKEITRNEQDVVEVIDAKQVKVREHKFKVDLTKYIEEHSFKFDSAFGEEVSNTQLYQNCVRPIVECAFLGARVTCFAYGQTGSGKTYTMNGDLEGNCPGIYYLGAEDIFALRDSSYEDLTVAVSFYEIYCGKLFDLLNSREQLQARQDGKQNVNIVGLTVKPINNPSQFMETIAAGSSVRITSQNSTNADSSRSHAILQISLMSKKKIHGKISFIDLAGCERGADTIDQNKQTKIDGAQINKSLLALKECIRALDQGKNHTPFRGSKLTMVLKDSFTGFCKTVMIGNVSPGTLSCENTLNTLRYADRVKELKKGGNTGNELKEDQLARQLMLPRNLKNKQIIIKNEDDSDQQIIIKPAELKQNPQTRPNTSQPQKKTKYIQQSKVQDQQNLSNIKKKQQTQNFKNIRKGVMQVQNNPQTNNNNARSVAHSNISTSINPHRDTGRMQRNKSLANKCNLKGIQRQVGANYQMPKKQPVTQRRSFNQNYSAANLHEKYRQILEQSQKIKGNFGRQSHNTSQQQNQNILGNNSNKFNTFSKNLQHQYNNNKENQTSSGQPFTKIKTQKSDENWIGKDKDNQWQSITDRIKNWKGNQEEFPQISSDFEDLVKMIMKQELQLSDCHKKILLSEQKALQESFNLYNQSQKHSKNNQEMIDYTSRVHSHLSTRIRGLVELQTRIQMYQYHLRQHESCEMKLLEASGTMMDVDCLQSEGGLWDA